ncbi:MAG: CBS domain-containing protein [Candidatus Aenigmarchaeota archaeon]|nr:CBS domain-containing protein [Candidatus Aenigmarchaeota archaeon]
MLVRDIMNRDVLTIEPDISLQEAAMLMIDNHVGSLVVLKGNRIAGMLTERDFIRFFAEGSQMKAAKVRDAMTNYVITVSVNANIKTAIQLLNQHAIKKLPVLDGDRLAGIVTSTDIVRANPRMLKDMSVLGRK